MTTTTNATNTTMTTVALSKLTASHANVRRVESEAGLTELCASIKAHGLLQNLTVRKGNKGKYEVVAGARRLAALRALANQPESGFDRASLIPVHVLESQNDTEISLAENTVRVNMHVADQIEAFRKLIEEDAMTPEQVGDRFGISHMTVRRRVKLAKVSPRIMDEFRSGKASLQQMEALAVADDHGAQEDAFYNLPEWNRDERNIRARLTSEKISAENRLVQFVGLDAYREAGGTITQDLFSEQVDTYLDSKALVMKLVSAKLEEAAGKVQAEGWKWAEYYSSERECGQQLPTIPSFKREHSESENAEVAEIMAFIEAFEPAYEAEQMTPEEKAEYETKIARADQIDAACIGHDPELMAFAGVRLFLNHQGEISVLRGLLKSAEQHELAARERAKRQAEAEAIGAASVNSDDETVSGEEMPDPLPPIAQPEQDMADGYSMALISDLTATRTAALAFEVSQRPDVGLALAVHALALRSFYEDRYGQGYGYGSFEASCVRIAGTKQPRPIGTADPDNEAAFAAFREAKERLQAKLPEQKHELFAWCLAADQKVLLDMLAFCVAAQIDAQASDMKAGNLTHASQIAEAVSLDMGKWWHPSESFFKRISKKMIAGAVIEAGCAPQIAKAILDAPKAEAVLTALEAIAQKGWTPPPLRGRVAVAEAVAIMVATDGEGASGKTDNAEAEFADNGEDEDGALASVYGPDDSGHTYLEAAE